MNSHTILYDFMEGNSENTAIYIISGRTINMVYVAAIGTIVYDTALSLADEVKYVWCGMRWSTPKLLYMISRYYCPLYLLVELTLPTYFESVPRSLTTCITAVWFHECAGVVIISTVVDLIFLLRVNAIYQRSKRIVLFVTIGFIVQFAAALTTAIFTSITLSSATIAIPGLGCSISGDGSENLSIKLLDVYYGMSVLFHIVLFVLTIARAGSDVRQTNGACHLRRVLFWREANHTSPIIVSVLRDGTLYFCILFVTAIMMVLAQAIGYKPHSIFPEIASLLQIAILSFTGCRMILHLRKLSDLDHEDANEMTTPSIFFAQLDWVSHRVEENGIALTTWTR
ncbi:hypothetical protein BDQ17DRAFT_1358029 [Cyathus striatus]|nr:hypothetical protein BDQ17DRAFT_1358029 [Cyathus striatus]